tara:strand:- start:2744 stop:3277 length:534 start_codon:yes stop_codon:yes gene_type:complete
MAVIPVWQKQDSAFNSLTKEFREVKFQNKPMNIKIHNPRFTGNGMRGNYHHNKNTAESLANATILKREKPDKTIELDAEKIKEKEQIDMNGAMLKGKMVTNVSSAKKWIASNKVKYGRGKHRVSGHWSGGLLRREYEKNTRLAESIMEEPEDEEDEFGMLEDKIQEEESESNIKRGF